MAPVASRWHHTNKPFRIRTLGAPSSEPPTPFWRLWCRLYGSTSIRGWLHLHTPAFNLIRWIAERDIPLSMIDEVTVALYVSSFQRVEHKTRPNGCLSHWAVGINKLLVIMRQQGIVAVTAERTPETEREKWLSETMVLVLEPIPAG